MKFLYFSLHCSLRKSQHLSNKKSLVTLFISRYFLPSGASACVELKQFEEAITWCDKGLAVSFDNNSESGISGFFF